MVSDTSVGAIRYNLAEDPLINVFKEKTIQHKNLILCYEKLVSEIVTPGGEQIIFVFGPSGVGKTTLLQGTIRHLKQYYLHRCEVNPSFVPFTFVEASSQSGVFDWKDHWVRFLSSVDEPLINKKKVSIAVDANERGSAESIQRATPTNNLRRAAERVVINRKCIVNFIDEAQHMKRTGRSAKALSDQMDAIKSFANITRSKVVLAGTYELLDFLKLSGQLSRRSTEIHFSRYRWDDAEDQLDFAKIVNTLQVLLPYNGDQKFVDDLPYYYRNSLGCIGILKDWMTRALRHARMKSREFVTLEDIRESELSDARLVSMLNEVQDGEKRYNLDSMFDLDAMLGIGAQSGKKGNGSVSTNSKKGNYPGKRLPVRDTVGARDA